MWLNVILAPLMLWLFWFYKIFFSILPMGFGKSYIKDWPLVDVFNYNSKVMKSGKEIPSN